MTKEQHHLHREDLHVSCCRERGPSVPADLQAGPDQLHRLRVRSDGSLVLKFREHWNMPGKPGPTQNFWYSYVGWAKNDGQGSFCRMTVWYTTSFWTLKQTLGRESTDLTKWCVHV